jgi:hypothetical protein
MHTAKMPSSWSLVLCLWYALLQSPTSAFHAQNAYAYSTYSQGSKSFLSTGHTHARGDAVLHMNDLQHNGVPKSPLEVKRQFSAALPLLSLLTLGLGLGRPSVAAASTEGGPYVDKVLIYTAYMSKTH